MTQPDEEFPTTAANYSSLELFAAKTQEDWEAEQQQDLTGHFADAETGFLGILTQIPIIGDIIEAVSGVEDGLISGIVDRLQNIDVLGLFDPAGLDPLNIGNIPMIPSLNVEGIGGLEDIGSSVQAFLDSVWQGFSKLSGSGKSLADVANIATATINTAREARDLGDDNSVILAVRNNKSIYQDVDETSESTFNMAELVGASDPPNFGVTSTTSPIAFWRATESANKGFVSWFGKGYTDVTALYVDVYKLDAGTNTLAYQHSSDDMSGLIGASWGYLIYNMDEGDRVAVEPGEVYGFSLRMTGTGTHTIAGKQITWLPDHPTVVPARPAAVRSGGTSDISMDSITYSGNIPWLGVGIVTGDIEPPIYAPRTTQVTAAGAYSWDWPTWAQFVDVIAVGAGAGGDGGWAFPITTSGKGGDGGDWFTATLERGVDTDAGVTEITGSVGAGGDKGDGSNNTASPGRQATDGGSTTAICTGWAGDTAVGGVRGVSGNRTGLTPGDETYGGTTFHGGHDQSQGSNVGSDGNPPGGGGEAGRGAVIPFSPLGYDGGDGAPGSVWFVARSH